jgi:uncharacterized protein (DUF433 family)
MAVNHDRDFMRNQVSDVNWKERITVDPEVLAGKPIIKGTRISVEFVLELLARGATVTDILEEYDHITAEDIQACLAYAGELLKSERIYVNPS